MNRSRSIGIAIAGALLLPVVLLAQSVQRDWDKAYDFTKVKTYSSKIGTGWNNQLSEKRVLAEFDEALGEKGWTHTTEDKADMQVVLHGATEVKHTLNTFYSGMG